MEVLEIIPSIRR